MMQAERQAGGSRQDQPVVMRRDDGGHDEVEFFGDGELLFGCRHVPAGDVRAGLVVCPSILSDSGANYQREVRLGRQLAGPGSSCSDSTRAEPATATATVPT